MTSGAPDGLLLIDKPTGPTSHDVIDRVRRLLARRRVGHTGTLDPMASGLLLLVVGRATRLARYLPQAPKVYTGQLRLGLVTDSDDVTGSVTSRHEGPLPPASRVFEVASSLVGRQLQAPPAVSARKVGGRRMYRLARSGVAVEAPPREVRIDRFDLSATEHPDLFAFEAEVSTGTYIRALARDLGAGLGCGGTLAALRRTRIGTLAVEQASTLPSGDETGGGDLAAATIPLGRMPIELATVWLADEAEAARFVAGVRLHPRCELPAGAFAVRDPEEALLGIGEAREGLLQPRVVVAGRD